MIDLASVPDTPALVIDETVALQNIERFQIHCDRVGLKVRPHVKTHKSVHFAKAQIAAGAVGVTCQKIGEAEVMADAEIDDILIAYNILGRPKLDRLRELGNRVTRLAVVADSVRIVDGLSDAFRNADRPLRVLVECDTGGGRCGVDGPEEAANLARVIRDSDGLEFGGLMTFPAVGGQPDVTQFMTSAKSELVRRNIDCPVISSGGTPDMWSCESGGVVTEYRPGTYIFNDRSLLENGTAKLEDCAAFVVATVVSTPTETRAIVDAGSKTLTSDLFGLDGYGAVVGHPTIRIETLSEEHGILGSPSWSGLKPGDRLAILPNHICVTVNMFDRARLTRGSNPVGEIEIDARGMTA